MNVKKLTQGPPVYVVSGGVGATGELLARTVLAQFHAANAPLHIEPRIRTVEQIDALVKRVKNEGGVIVHTLVNPACRQAMLETATRRGVWQIDLVGPLMTYLADAMGREPAGQPGLYRQLHKAYFDRIEAIEFAVAHDDGKRVGELSEAEIVLVGVSRVGKTPLSMFLAMQGYLVANIAFVMEAPPPPELNDIDPRCVVGLIIEPAQLISHRRTRLLHTGMPAGSYVDRQSVVEELRAVKHFFARNKFPVIDASGKPIETSAEEVINLITRRKQ